MLARSAEGLYWLGRHVERTEDVCRLVREQMGALVDRPVREINFGWRRIYGALRRRPPGPAVGVAETDDDYALADSYTLADDVTFERANPGSILNSFSNGRENARQMRHCISGPRHRRGGRHARRRRARSGSQRRGPTVRGGSRRHGSPIVGRRAEPG